MTSKYFSGFCLQGEQELFKSYIVDKQYTVCGFSYGAIKAFEYVLNSQKRVDTLQLFSPAFFQTNTTKFIRMQLMFFKKDAKNYCENFLKNISYPSDIDMKRYFYQSTYEELEELLNYKWDENKLQKLVDRGINIEVFLGEDDKIIDSKKACEFFKNYSTTYYIKNKGHIL